MKSIYRVNFIGRLNKSIGQTAYLTKTYAFEKPLGYDEIVEKVYETHEHVKILRITDLSKAAAFNELKKGRD